MTRAFRTRLRLIRNSENRTRGTSLIELIVAMTLLSVVAGIMATVITNMANDVVKQQNSSRATDGIHAAYTLLDKQARYADAINTPATSNGKLYVEFEMPADAVLGGGAEPGCPSPSTSSVTCCVQWRLNTTSKLLDWRSWWTGATPTTTFNPAAYGVSAAPGASAAFSLNTSTSDPRQSLNLALQTSTGTGSSAGGNLQHISTAVLTSSFTAYNSTSGAAPTTAVCNAASNRP